MNIISKYLDIWHCFKSKIWLKEELKIRNTSLKEKINIKIKLNLDILSKKFPKSKSKILKSKDIKLSLLKIEMIGNIKPKLIASSSIVINIKNITK